MNNVDLIKHIYDRFAHGDAASVLSAFDPRIEFRLAEGHPYQPSGQPWIGHDAIAKNFFMRAAPEWANWTVEVSRMIDARDTVVVEARYRGLYKPTGRPMDLQVCHVWTIANGNVTSFHQYLDTARLHEIMQPSPAMTRGS